MDQTWIYRTFTCRARNEFGTQSHSIALRRACKCTVHISVLYCMCCNVLLSALLVHRLIVDYWLRVKTSARLPETRVKGETDECIFSECKLKIFWCLWPVCNSNVRYFSVSLFQPFQKGSIIFRSHLHIHSFSYCTRWIKFKEGLLLDLIATHLFCIRCSLRSYDAILDVCCMRSKMVWCVVAVPGTPRELNVTRRLPTMLIMNAVNPSDDGGMPVIGYRVQYDNKTLYDFDTSKGS